MNFAGSSLLLISENLMNNDTKALASNEDSVVVQSIPVCGV